MPVTPFHFGVGLLGKGVFPAWMSLTAFVLSQIAIDLESGYYLFVVREWPVHRTAHTFAAGLAIGAVVAGLVWAAGRLVERRGLGVPWPREVDPGPALVGGVLGGTTHALLDGVMHSDVRPFLPWSGANPLLGTVGLPALHLACVGAGLLGLALLLGRAVIRGRRSGV